MSEQVISVVLGDEYDDALHEALRAVLICNGAVEVEKSWGVGGSQEIESQHIELAGHQIVIESETFVGLSISGPKSVVEKIADEVQKKITL